MIRDKHAIFILMWRFWLAADIWPIAMHAVQNFRVSWIPSRHFFSLTITFGTKAFLKVVINATKIIIECFFIIYSVLRWITWYASSRWFSSQYCPKRNSDQMTIGKAHPTLWDSEYPKTLITRLSVHQIEMWEKSPVECFYCSIIVVIF